MDMGAGGATGHLADHDDGVVDLDLCMADAAIGHAMDHFGFGAEDGGDEIERLLRVLDDEIGREAVVAGGLVHGVTS